MDSQTSRSLVDREHREGCRGGYLKLVMNGPCHCPLEKLVTSKGSVCPSTSNLMLALGNFNHLYFLLSLRPKKRSEELSVTH